MQGWARAGFCLYAHDEEIKVFSRERGSGVILASGERLPGQG